MAGSSDLLVEIFFGKQNIILERGTDEVIYNTDSSIQKRKPPPPVNAELPDVLRVHVTPNMVSQPDSNRIMLPQRT